MLSGQLAHRISLSLLVAVAGTTLFYGQAKAQEHSTNIVDTAVAADGFETLVAAVDAAGLVDTLKQSGPFTVFAPNDAAFASLPAGTLESLLKPENKAKLQAVLTFHVVPGKVTARQAFQLDHAATVNGQRLTIEQQNGKLSIGGAKILATDIPCSNGIIHVIDRVLLPQQERIPAVASTSGQFATLLAAVTAAELGDTLDSSGPFTVFAPTDEAFEKLPAGTVKSLLKPKNRQKLTDILKLHVLSGRVYSNDAAEAGQAKTLLGQVVETSVTADGLLINNATVVKADLDTANGVIHVIDTVLLPVELDSKQAMVMLKDAIQRGVPIYNHGSHRECATIYAEACQAIVDSAGDEMPDHVTQTLRSALDRAEHMHFSSSRAWVLRHAMDSVLHSMTQMSL